MFFLQYDGKPGEWPMREDSKYVTQHSRISLRKEEADWGQESGEGGTRGNS